MTWSEVHQRLQVSGWRCARSRGVTVAFFVSRTRHALMSCQTYLGASKSRRSRRDRSMWVSFVTQDIPVAKSSNLQLPSTEGKVSLTLFGASMRQRLCLSLAWRSSRWSIARCICISASAVSNPSALSGLSKSISICRCSSAITA